MTLNDLERCNGPFLRFSPISIAVLAKYVIVVEYRLIISVNIVSQFQSSTFGHNYPTLQRGLSAIAVLLVFADNCSVHTLIASVRLALYMQFRKCRAVLLCSSVSLAVTRSDILYCTNTKLDFFASVTLTFTQ